MNNNYKQCEQFEKAYYKQQYAKCKKIAIEILTERLKKEKIEANINYIKYLLDGLNKDPIDPEILCYCKSYLVVLRDI